jgi:hypothetical protein
VNAKTIIAANACEPVCIKRRTIRIIFMFSMLCSPDAV